MNKQCKLKHTQSIIFYIEPRILSAIIFNLHGNHLIDYNINIGIWN